MTIPYTENPAWADGSGGGTPISAAKLNAIEQGITDAHLMPKVRVGRSTTQAIPTATDTAVQFTTEIFDEVGGAASTMHDNATNNTRLTARYAGAYLVTGNAIFAGNATGRRYMWIRPSTDATARMGYDSAPANATENPLSSTTLVQLAVNDYVELIVHQDSGGDLNISASYNQFAMVRVA